MRYLVDNPPSYSRFHLTQKLQEFGFEKLGDNIHHADDTEDYELLEDDDFFLENNTIEPESFFSNDADDDFFMNIDDEILSSSQQNCKKLESEEIGFSAASKTPLSSRKRKDSKKSKRKPMKTCRSDGVDSNEKVLEEDSSDQFYTAPESPNPKGPSGRKGKTLRSRRTVNCNHNSKEERPDSSDSEVLFSDSDEYSFSSNHSSALSQNARKGNQLRKRQRDSIVKVRGPRSSTRRISRARGSIKSEIFSDIDSDSDIMTDIEDSDGDFMPEKGRNIESNESTMITRSKVRK